MLRYSEDATEEDLDRFVASLPQKFFTHKDVMRCYSIFQRNEYQRAIRNPAAPPPVRQQPPEQKARKQRRIWSKAELEALKVGVERIGRNWVGIIKAFPAVFGPTARTAADLEKKWNRLAAKGDTRPCPEFAASIAMPAGE
jgi:hypothetical protein